MTTLTFLGAAKTVTGSKYLLQTGIRRVLVDCGLFQGLKELRERNWQPFPVEPSSLDAVVLTHAHIDHTGYLPRLVKQGFRGRVFCTPGTADLCRIMLPDAGRLAEEDAREANRHGYSKHAPALPLFTEEDALAALTHLQPVGLRAAGARRTAASRSPSPTRATCSGRRSSASASTARRRRRRSSSAAISAATTARCCPIRRRSTPRTSCSSRAPTATASTSPTTTASAWRRSSARRSSGGGKVIIPAFAVGRVEEVIYWLRKLEEARRIPVVPVYLDSPMAVQALKYYASHSNDLDPDMRTRRGEMSAFTTKRFTAVASPQQSREIQASRLPSIVISSSGMATGGRVLHYLKAALPNPRHTVLFVGYQAAGTRGRKLLEGADTVKIHGQLVPVAARIERIDSMSAHADADEILRWLRAVHARPRR